ncbi:MAG: leucine-rich repeat protein [Oscillospiraceae bacterium]|nr:leucine-rich repeat protein [Oscillospiraceae bacterium]
MNLKKSASVFMSLAVSSVCLMSLPSYAEDEIISSGDYQYSLDDDEACLMLYTGDDTDIIIPDEIDGYPITSLSETFHDTNVASVTLNNNIEYIDENTFINCYYLTEIIVPDENQFFESKDGVLFEDDMKTLLCYPSAKDGDSYEIPEGVTDIGIASVYDTKLQSIKFPSSLEYIDRHGVSYNQRLTEADLSNTVLVSVGEMSFAGNTSLKKLSFPDTLYEIDNGAFAQCSALDSVTLPPNLGIIGQNAFAGTALNEITIPASVEDIGYSAFGYDENLEPVDSFVIKGVSGSIAQTYATDTDEEYDYQNNFTFISTDSQTYEELEGIPFGDFEYAEKDGEAYITLCTSSEKNIEVPAEINGLPVTVIYGMAFYQSDAESIKLPESLKRIEIMAFYDCDSLTVMDIPEGTEEIMAQAFYQCDNLKEINLPSTCSEIGSNAFSLCKNLTAINIAEGNNTYKSDNGIVFSSDMTELIKYPDGKENIYKLPDSVKSVADYAFSENPNITEIDLNKAESIGIDSFSFCGNLKKVSADKLKSIGEYALYECTSLTELKLPSSLETVGQFAVYQCPELLSVHLGNNITEINECAFGYIYDEANNTNLKLAEFTIYADKDSGGAKYAETCGFETVSGTVQIGSHMVDKIFLIVVSSALGIIIVAVIAVIAVKSARKRKKSPEEKNL